MTMLLPATVGELCEVVADAAAHGRRLALQGGGSKALIGAPECDALTVGMGRFAGIVDYDPEELVLTVRAGTPLAEIAALVEAHGQMLAFDPHDHGPIFGRPVGAATIGGVIAARVSGSARVSSGGARDHLLGFQAVSGRGEALVGGAKVVKNVTGYDLPKIVTGSWGRLVALTQVTLKVLPRPKVRVTLVVQGLDVFGAQRVMARAMGSQADVAAAAHLPGEKAMTALRMQGFGPSVAARCELLRGVLAEFGDVDRLEDDAADTFWAAMRDVAPLAGEHPLWRINIPPSGAGAVVTALEEQGARWLLDWAGGLVWAATEAEASAIRAAAADAGGHAMLVRAPASMRAITPALHPEGRATRALSRRIRRAFDPAGVFETGRFLDDTDAD